MHYQCVLRQPVLFLHFEGGMDMILNAFEQKTALDYIVYMMMGSHFKKAAFSSKRREKSMELFYMLLGNKLQIELEALTEQCFLKTIRPGLPQKFLDSPAKVVWVNRGDGGQTAVVFANPYGQLWVVTRYGGRIKKPEFYHFFAGEGTEAVKKGQDSLRETYASCGRAEALWQKLEQREKKQGRRARKKRPA